MAQIREGYIPGSIGRVVELHGQYYAANWNFGVFFEAKVAKEMAEFITRYDPEKDAFWTVSENDRVEGAIVIDGIHAENEGAHLRWFIMSEKLAGKGYGNELIDKAIRFCKNRSYKKVYLWTFEGLKPARRLYEKSGFELVHEQRGQQWGTEVTEQKFLLKLS